MDKENSNQQSKNATKLSTWCSLLSLMVSASAISVCIYSEIQIASLQKQLKFYELKLNAMESRLSILETPSYPEAGTVEYPDVAHFLRKRSADDDSAMDVLAGLSMAQVTELLRGAPGAPGAPGSPGKDGRDGRDGRDCEESSMNTLKQLTSALLNQTGPLVTTTIPPRKTDIDYDELLRQFNETIAYGLIRLLQSNDRKLAELQSEFDDSALASKTTTSSAPSDGAAEVVGAGGSEYVRWGRKTCGNTSELIYSGFAAGQHYTQKGGAAEYICLPFEPEYNSYLAGDQGNYIYGAEYETNSYIFPQRMQNHNAPCARCYVPKKTTTVMIGAKRTCPVSWTKEYEGYLMSGHDTHERAYSYACVDKDPEALSGSHENKDGALFYFVQASCYSIGQCPPYIEGAELACVVCSK